VADRPARHGLADFLEGELPKLQAEWEAGAFSSLIEAFLWCAGNGYTFPHWLREAVKDELEWSMENRPRGGTKQGNAAAFERADRIRRVRHGLVDQLLKFQLMDREQGRRTSPVSEIEAAREAADFLREQQHVARGSAAAILKSYKSLMSG
jgi:hypothetical protein